MRLPKDRDFVETEEGFVLADPRDPLERDARDVVQTLAVRAGVAGAAFGITGSVLIGLHDPRFSDLDLTVYGRDNALRAKRALAAPRDGLIRELPPARMAQWRNDTERFSLPAGDVADLAARRWNYFQFRERYVSLHPIRADAEIMEAYGQERYRSAGIATIEATVIDARDALFLPAVYGLDAVAVLEGPGRPVRQLVSFEALYAGIAEEGERVQARGQLEVSSGGDCRLVVGTGALWDGGFVKRLTHV